MIAKKIAIAICILALASVSAMDVQNGLSGMNRNVILRLIDLMGDKPESIRAVMGMFKEHFIWKTHFYFINSRRKQLAIPEERRDVYVNQIKQFDGKIDPVALAGFKAAAGMVLKNSTKMYRDLISKKRNNITFDAALREILKPAVPIVQIVVRNFTTAADQKYVLSQTYTLLGTLPKEELPIDYVDGIGRDWRFLINMVAVHLAEVPDDAFLSVFKQLTPFVEKLR